MQTVTNVAQIDVTFPTIEETNLTNYRVGHKCDRCDPIIGQGERFTIKIISELFPDAVIKTQVPLDKLLTKDFVEDMGSRAKKETVDVLLERAIEQDVVIRVQDDRHKTKQFTIIDSRQKWELEYCGYIVIDVWKEDCPQLFKEKKFDLAKNELKRVLDNHL
jgi:hypothetical protein